MDVRWNLKSHLTCTLVELILGHARWMRGEIWKVIWHTPHMRTFPLYTFQMSSDMDARWYLKSHLMSTLRENFGVFGHARWMWGEIWKVILHAPCMRTLVWWRGHLVTLDGLKVKFEKSSHMHLGGVNTWSCYMDARWNLKSHLAWISYENFGVVKGTLGHTRWMWGEIWKSSHVHLA